MKLHYRLVKFERALVFQVLEQSPFFLAKDYDDRKSFKASNGFDIESCFEPELCENLVYLRGSTDSHDFDPVLRVFATNLDRDAYAQRLMEALEDWSKRAFPSLSEVSKGEWDALEIKL